MKAEPMMASRTKNQCIAEWPPNGAKMHKKEVRFNLILFRT
jgi:hypothetical protein